jgi:hypothetical protein
MHKLFREFFIAIAILILSAGALPVSAQPAPTLPVLAQQWAKAKGWPATRVELSRLGTVTAQSLPGWATRIVDGIATVNNRPIGPGFEVHRFVNDPRYAATKAQRVQELQTNGLLSVGDAVFQVRWEIAGLPAFATLATQNSKGKTKFEPVLYLDGTAKLQPTAVHHSNISIPINLTAANGLADECLTTQWLFAAVTDQCNISDPPEHIHQKVCKSSCWMWEPACTEGEDLFTRPAAPACPVLQCVKDVMEVEWATWGSNIKIEAGVDASADGVKVHAKLTAQPGYTGHTGGPVVTPLTVCADGTAALDGRPQAVIMSGGGGSSTTAAPQQPGPNDPGTCWSKLNCTGDHEPGTPTQCFQDGGASWSDKNGNCWPVRR